MTLETITLTDQQEHAVRKAVAYLDDLDHRPYLSIGGYAGTGKTTVLKSILASTDLEPICCAFTGKAALRMRQKGVDNAGTIHSQIYRYNKETNSYSKKWDLEGDFFLIDEASMIPVELWNDVLSYGLPIILVGDMGQLEPVGKDPALMTNPQVVLDKIHRQAEQSDIVTLATKIRHDQPYVQNAYNPAEVEILRPRMLTDDHLLSADIIICAFNKSRLQLNARMRRLMKRDNKTLVRGDRIICLANNNKIGVFNGEMFTVEEVIDVNTKTIKARIKPDFGETLNVILYADQFDNGKNLARAGKWVTKNGRKRFIPDIANADEYVFADYGYAITCHKSQGSEWDEVLIIDEQCPKLWDAKRWRYTAVTRAARKVRFIL